MARAMGKFQVSQVKAVLKSNSFQIKEKTATYNLPHYQNNLKQKLLHYLQTCASLPSCTLYSALNTAQHTSILQIPCLSTAMQTWVKYVNALDSNTFLCSIEIAWCN